MIDIYTTAVVLRTSLLFKLLIIIVLSIRKKSSNTILNINFKLKNNFLVVVFAALCAVLPTKKNEPRGTSNDDLRGTRQGSNAELEPLTSHRRDKANTNSHPPAPSPPSLPFLLIWAYQRRLQTRTLISLLLRVPLTWARLNVDGLAKTQPVSQQAGQQLLVRFMPERLPTIDKPIGAKGGGGQDLADWG